MEALTGLQLLGRGEGLQETGNVYGQATFDGKGCL